MTAVESGRALLLALAEQPRAFSLILTDVAMPDVNGLEVLRYVRSQPMLHSLPVIMMSAHENAGTGARRGAQTTFFPAARSVAPAPLTPPSLQSSPASTTARRTTC